MRESFLSRTILLLSLIQATALVAPAFSLASGSVSKEPPINSVKLISVRPNVPVGRDPVFGERTGTLIAGFVLTPDRAYEEAKKVASDPKLRAYYATKEEQEAFALEVKHVFDQEIGFIVGLDKAIRGVDFLAETIGSKVMDRILKKASIPAARRTAWANLLIQQVHSCIVQSKSLKNGALPCQQIFADSMPANIGLAMTYEIVHDKLLNASDDPAALFKRVDSEFRQCAKRNNYKADVETCARQSIKTGIEEVAGTRLAATLRPQYTDKKNKNKDREKKKLFATTLNVLKKNLGTCLDGALVKKRTDDVGVSSCLDQLVYGAGTRAIHDRIMSESAIAEYFKTPAERVRFSATHERTFTACLDDQKKKHARDGVVLVTTPCEDLVTNDITETIVLKKLQDAALSSLKPLHKNDPKDVAATAKQQSEAVAEARSVMDHCWNKFQDSPARESCLRSTVTTIAGALASRVLDQQTGAAFDQARPDAKPALVKGFKECVTGRLPANISEDPNITSKIGQCVGPLRRSSALEIAEFQIRGYLKGEVPEGTMEALVQKLVKRDFAGCLGKSPNEKTADRCVFALKQSSAKEIGSARFPIEIWKLLPAATTDEEADLYARKGEEATKDVTAGFRACIDQNVRAENADHAETEIDRCTKQSVQKIALFVAQLQIDSKVADLYGDNVKGLADLKKDLFKELSQCMSKAESLEFSRYVLQVKVCGDATSERAILYIARNQLNRILHDIEHREQGGAAPKQPQNPNNQIPACDPGTGSVVELTKKVEEMKKSMDDVLAAYISYDLKTAKKDVLLLLAKINQELQTEASPETRQRVIDWLSKDTAVVGQALKAIVREIALDGFKAMPDAERPKPELIAKITSNKALDSMFNTAKGKAITQSLITDLLEPVVVGDVSLQSPEVKKARDQLTQNVKNLLIHSPEFGQTLADGSTQAEIDKSPRFDKGMIRLIQLFKASFHTAFSRNALNWDKIKETPKGKLAEDYILDKIVRPGIDGEQLTDAEKASRNKEAERLVKNALLARH